jgi:hypothetical protein
MDPRLRGDDGAGFGSYPEIPWFPVSSIQYPVSGHPTPHFELPTSNSILMNIIFDIISVGY